MVFKLQKISVLLLILTVIMIAGCSSRAEPTVDNIPDAIDNSIAQEEISDTQSTKTFLLSAENFKFIGDDPRQRAQNPDIRVKVGDKVKITLNSVEGFHDWVLDEFNARTLKVKAGDPETSIDFVADKKGTFEYYCSVGSHRANGMKGNFIVE
mgnify:CR=1 FL=1